jgi:uncharacterized integral membrane protein
MSNVTSPARGTGFGDSGLRPNGASPAAHRSALRRQQRDGARRPAVEGPAPGPEPRGERLVRGGRRTALYVRAAAIAGLLAVLIALIAANTRSVELNWVFGSGEASLVWIIFFTGIVAWLLGLATAALFRRRTRRRDPNHDTRVEEPAR